MTTTLLKTTAFLFFLLSFDGSALAADTRAQLRGNSQQLHCQPAGTPCAVDYECCSKSGCWIGFCLWITVANERILVSTFKKKHIMYNCKID